MSGYSLGTDVELDLDAIWEFIADDSLDAADRWIDKLFEAFETLARTPRLGRIREDLTAHPVRFWPVGTYLVIYRAERNPIEIVAVTQGRVTFPHSLAAAYHCYPKSNDPLLLSLCRSCAISPRAGSPLRGRALESPTHAA